MSEEQVTAIIYTDGGCNPNPGPGGSGFHGKLSTGIMVDAWHSVSKNSTNNESELLAAASAIEYAMDKGVKNLSLNPDSMYLIDGITKWHYGWIKRDWIKADGKEVPNKQTWLKLIANVKALKETGCTISWNWVKGHSGVIENERADENATRGVIATTKGIEVSELIERPEKSYDKRKPAKYNRLLAMDKWYFTTKEPVIAKSGYHVYLCGYHGKADAKERADKVDTSFGKELPDVYQAVVYLNEPDEALEAVRKGHYELLDTSLGLINVGLLSKINTSDVFEELQNYGDTYLSVAKNKETVVTIKDIPISRIANPPKLAFDAMELLVEHNYRLESFVTGKLSDVVATDITSEFYEKTEGKKGKAKWALRSDVDTNRKSMKVMVETWDKEQEITLSLGLDTPIRNTLSALVSEETKIHVLTWKSGDHCFRYGTVLSTPEGHVFWVSSYANLAFIK